MQQHCTQLDQCFSNTRVSPLKLPWGLCDLRLAEAIISTHQQIQSKKLVNSVFILNIATNK